MKITIIYDNESRVDKLRADWGFSCLIEHDGVNILFDTGTKGALLLENMKVLGIDPGSIHEVFISHSHFDHAGGLASFLNENENVKVYAPGALRGINPVREAVYNEKAGKLRKGFYTTGLLDDIEQSLAIRTAKGLVVVFGCSHPGVGKILKAAEKYGKPYALVGGLHGFDEYEILKPLQLVCPTHCTQHIDEIKSRYPDKYVPGGAGGIIEI